MWAGNMGVDRRRWDSAESRVVKRLPAFPALVLFGVILVGSIFGVGCTTLENRRDLYSPQRVDGPYTRMLRDGVPDWRQEGVETTATQTVSSSKNVVR